MARGRDWNVIKKLIAKETAVHVRDDPFAPVVVCRQCLACACCELQAGFRCQQ